MLRQGLCFAAGQERGVSPEEAPSPPGPSPGRQQELATGREQGWPWLLQGHHPRLASPLGQRCRCTHGGSPGMQEGARPAPWPAQSSSRDERLPRRQAPTRRKLGFFFPPVTHLSLISLGVSLQILQILQQMLCSPQLSSPRRLPGSKLPATGAEGRENTNPINPPTNNPCPTGITSGNAEAVGAFIGDCGSPSLHAAPGNNRFCGRGHQTVHQPQFQPASVHRYVLCSTHRAGGLSFGPFLPTPGPSSASPAREVQAWPHSRCASLPLLQTTTPGGRCLPCQSSDGRCFHLLL